MKLTRWMCTLLLACLAVTPIFAGTGDDTAKAKGSTATASDDKDKDKDKDKSDTKSDAKGDTANTAASSSATSSSATPAPSAKVTALLDMLVKKGILAPGEASQIRSASPDAELQLLVEALNRKGILSAADLTAVDSNAAPAAAAPSGPTFVAPSSADATSAPVMTAEVQQQQQPVPKNPQPQTQAAGAEPISSRPAVPGVVPAVVPIRALPIDSPTKDGLVAAFRIGGANGVKMTPYGFIKASAAHDSSSPNGDDFPFVGIFLSSTSILNTGPTKDPEFHLKARSTRFGANFEWPDPSPKLIVTGRVEGDFEGNFSEVDNRDVTSIRSNALQLRLAYVRLDYNITDRMDLFFEGGQDWAIFSSTVLPNLFETTFLGAFYGTIYGRTPQMRFGTTYKVSNWRNIKISPEFALMMPSTGQIEKLGSLGLQGQIGQAEREGADANRPELESRVVLQFQLDKAPAVPTAQIFWAGFYSRRRSIVTTSNYGTPTASCLANIVLCDTYEGAFPNGFTTSSKQYGNQVGFSLPTRFATLVGSGYFGGDLRFFLGGQVNSYATDTTLLSNPITFATVDGGPLAAAGAATLATITGTNIVAIAPQKPIRSFGGFLNLGLPVSRWFNADPKGRMGGWQVYLHIGKDQVVHRDLTNPNYSPAANTLSPLPLLMGKMFAATLYYKLNPWCTFGTEYSVYASRLAPGSDYSIAGSPSNEWQDHRIEFGPVFTF
jgi:hypothetical protein